MCAGFRVVDRGTGPTSSFGSLPAPHVACRCSPAGFDRRHKDTVKRVAVYIGVMMVNWQDVADTIYAPYHIE
jgi:hypothetical protein